MFSEFCRTYACINYVIAMYVNIAHCKQHHDWVCFRYIELYRLHCVKSESPGFTNAKTRKTGFWKKQPEFANPTHGWVMFSLSYRRWANLTSGNLAKEWMPNGMKGSRPLGWSWLNTIGPQFYRIVLEQSDTVTQRQYIVEKLYALFPTHGRDQRLRQDHLTEVE